MSGPSDKSPPLILCSTDRLAQSIQQSHGWIQDGCGSSAWQALPVMTFNQWLNQLTDTALLLGQIDAECAPCMVLDAVQERVLWQQVIEELLAEDVMVALFDLTGMATAAVDANRLLLAWDMAVPSGDMSEETRQFLQWRDRFQFLCSHNNWLEQVRFLDWQIKHLAMGVGQLPPEILLAGFDRISPQEQRFLDVLQARGTTVNRWQHDAVDSATIIKAGFSNQDEECRAAVAWCQQQLSADPQARIGLVVPKLAELREKLMSLLDDNLHPETVRAEHAETVRCYDFSLGTKLSEQPLIGVALSLLRLASTRHCIAQEEISALLLSPYWTADEREADARAQIDAKMRGTMPLTLSLERLLRFIQKHQSQGLILNELIMHIEAMLRIVQTWPKQQLLSAWLTSWQALLKAASWPGERSLSSHEYQARQAFEQLLEKLVRLDTLLGPVSATEALSYLEQSCREQIFQPRTEGRPRLLVMGMLESVAEPLAGLWVMGMNDHLWPPPAHPNPLLPTWQQRRSGVPNADGRTQAQFAQSIHQRLLCSATDIVFSFAHMDGERVLRQSPLLAKIVQATQLPELACTLAEQWVRPADMQWLVDHQAPSVMPGEKISGGMRLLKTQAICPAWAYYRYRLGARALDEPIDGLNAIGRGILLHMVLQYFWRGRDWAHLQGLDEAGLQQAIALAVKKAIRDFNSRREEPLSARFMMLEKQRLERLLTVWIPLEKARAAFTVMQCEQRVSLDLGGLTLDLVIDRVDRLADGRLLILDYKTGQTVSQKSWANERINEPQLPTYAALAMSGHEVAAVCFAKVHVEEQKFIGIAAKKELLPGVEDLDATRHIFDTMHFPDWQALMQHWRSSIDRIASEICSGDAAIRFADEKELRDCELKVLLRLPERKLQLERSDV